MKISILMFAAAAAPGALADFWLSYLSRVSSLGGESESDSGGTFLNNPQIDCNHDMYGLDVWGDSADVSSDSGMRTVPGNPVGPPLFRDPLDVVEFNTHDRNPGHQTIYKDRGYAMYDVGGTNTGQCYLNRTFTYDLDCYDGERQIRMQGSSMFFCQSDIGL